MTAPPDIRLRVLRLLSGERRTEDLHRILLWLRFRTRGRAPNLKDVGDFISHRDLRETGVTWERARDFCHVAEWVLSASDGVERRSIEMARKAVFASFRIHGPARAKAQFGVGAKRVEQALTRAMAAVNYIDFTTGEADMDDSLTPLEVAVLRFYIWEFRTPKGMTPEVLANELIELLSAEGLLSRSERQRLVEAAAFICVYAMSQMHGSTIVLAEGRDDTHVPLTLSYRAGKLRLSLMHMVAKTMVLTDVVATDLTPEDWLAPELITGPTDIVWVPVEFGPGGKLVPIEAAKLADRRVRLDLPDALAGDAELMPYLFDHVVGRRA